MELRYLIKTARCVCCVFFNYNVKSPKNDGNILKTEKVTKENRKAMFFPTHLLIFHLLIVLFPIDKDGGDVIPPSYPLPL